MTRSQQQLFTPLLLLGSSFLFLTIPAWLSYGLLGFITLGLSVSWIQNNQHLLKPIFHFLFEFFRFCLMVMIFVATITIMHGLLSMY